MMKFQRQGCVLSNDYKELSITETSIYFLVVDMFHDPEVLIGSSLDP
jgi:hypothetical protein